MQSWGRITLVLLLLPRPLMAQELDLDTLERKLKAEQVKEEKEKQADAARRSEEGRQGRLLIRSDAPCRLTVNGLEHGTLDAGVLVTLVVPPGQQLVECVATEESTAKQSDVVSLEPGTQRVMELAMAALVLGERKARQTEARTKAKAEQVKARGPLARGLLGVNIQDLNPADSQALGISRTGGALVSGFSDQSPALNAGVKLADVIVAFDGEEVRSASDLPPLVAATAPGTQSELIVIRDGKELRLNVVVTEAPPGAAGGSATLADSRIVDLGLVVEDLTDDQRRLLNVEGVAVARVTGAPASAAGLRGGDIVLMVGRKKVNSATDFANAISLLAVDTPVMFLVRRGDQTLFVTITPTTLRQQ